MAMHLEFVVPGPPISNQQNTQNGKQNLADWRAKIAEAAGPQWVDPLITRHVKAIVINFYAGNKPSVDVDNMSKPIFDEMQDLVYNDDRQIVQAEIAHLKIGEAFSIRGSVEDSCDGNPSRFAVRIRADRRPGRPIPTSKVMP